jgi:hypothetical protein
LLEAGLRICEAVGSGSFKGSDDVHVAGGNIPCDEEQHVSASSLTITFCSIVGVLIHVKPKILENRLITLAHVVFMSKI